MSPSPSKNQEGRYQVQRCQTESRWRLSTRSCQMFETMRDLRSGETAPALLAPKPERQL